MASYVDEGPVRESEISREMSDLFAAISHLGDLVSLTEEKLNPITRDNSPAGKIGSGDKELEKQLCPFAESLREHKKRVWEINSRLDSILSRIEL